MSLRMLAENRGGAAKGTAKGAGKNTSSGSYYNKSSSSGTGGGYFGGTGGASRSGGTTSSTSTRPSGGRSGGWGAPRRGGGGGGWGRGRTSAQKVAAASVTPSATADSSGTSQHPSIPAASGGIAKSGGKGKKGKGFVAVTESIPGLFEWLEKYDCEHQLDDALEWCESMGAATLEEVEEYKHELAEHLGVVFEEQIIAPTPPQLPSIDDWGTSEEKAAPAPPPIAPQAATFGYPDEDEIQMSMECGSGVLMKELTPEIDAS